MEQERTFWLSLKQRAHCQFPSEFIVLTKRCPPLRFALEHSSALGYFDSYESVVQKFMDQGTVEFDNEGQKVTWDFLLGDFPSCIKTLRKTGFWPDSSKSFNPDTISSPSAILFDAYSPAKNPSMWTHSLFSDIAGMTTPCNPCSMATYSRSTSLRVTLLLAGFYVGYGHGTGEKEQTTLAATSRSLLEKPLEKKWLQSVMKSTSAEPLWEPVYRQAPLSPDSLLKLSNHPQFQVSE